MDQETRDRILNGNWNVAKALDAMKDLTTLAQTGCWADGVPSWAKDLAEALGTFAGSPTVLMVGYARAAEALADGYKEVAYTLKTLTPKLDSVEEIAGEIGCSYEEAKPLLAVINRVHEENLG